MKTKIKGEYVIGYDPVARDHLIYRQGEVVYEDYTIIFAGHNYGEPVDEVIDAGLAMVSPGFIDLDALADIDHAILDCWVDPERDLGLLWSEEYFHHGRHDHFTRAEEASKHRYTLSQLALNGITTFMPIAGEYYKRWCETYDEWADVVEILGELGLRGYIGPSYRSGINVVAKDGSRHVLWDEAEGLAGLADAVRLVENFDGEHNGRVKGCLLPARIETVTLDLLRRTKAAAAELGCLTRLHCLQGTVELRFMRERYGKTTMQMLQELDLLGPRFLIPHALYIGGHSQSGYADGGEVELFAATGTPVIHCPLATIRGARVLESFRRYRAAGVKLALGTDTFPPDMIRVMEHGLTSGNLAEREKSSHQAADFFRAATLGGAEALGREDLGRLAPDAKADILIIDLNDYRLGPIDDPIRTLVMMGTSHAIRTVIVDGRVVVEDGQIPGMDAEAMRRQAQAYHAKMRAAYCERDYKLRPEEELFPPSFRIVDPPAHTSP